MKNHFEEVFLKQRSVNAGSAKGSEKKPPPPCYLMARCCSTPQRAVEWRVEGNVQAFGTEQCMTAQLCRTVAERVATWALRVVEVSSLSHPTVLVNGAPMSVVDLELSPGDIVEVPLRNASAEMWRIEWGPSFAQDVSLEAALPTVVSLSPFVVGEAAANRNVFDTMQAKVSMLEEQLQRVLNVSGASKRVEPFDPSPTDPPQLLLLHNMDWMLVALQGVEATLEAKPKRTDREAQTLPHAGYALNYRVAAIDSAPCLPSPVVHGGPIDAHDDRNVLKTQLASVAHALWVAREQLSVYATPATGQRRDNATEQASYVERLLHSNAELERRLNQRQRHVAELEREVRLLRAATAPDRTRRHTAVYALQDILASRGDAAVSVTTTAPNAPLPLQAEIRLWTAVAEVLDYVEKLEHALEASTLQLQEHVRTAEHRSASSLMEQRNVELREELSSLRAQGSVEAVVALQVALGSLAAQFGGDGHSRMSAWL